MTIEQLTAAFALAKSKSDYTSNLAWSIGFGLSDFKPVHTTIEEVAALIRYQCAQMNGGWDMVAFDEIARHGRRKFIIV